MTPKRNQSEMRMRVPAAGAGFGSTSTHDMSCARDADSVGGCFAQQVAPFEFKLVLIGILQHDVEFQRQSSMLLHYGTVLQH
jgi:hypothetical protein